MKKDKTTFSPIIRGGLGEKNFGKQYKPGNRVYDSNGVSMALMANTLGYVGGHSYLYIVKEQQRNNSDDKS